MKAAHIEIIFLFNIIHLISSQNFTDKEYTLRLPALAIHYGYPTKQYTLQTEDNYILSMFRMKRNETLDPQKHPILLVHGLIGSAEDFLRMGPTRSLAFLLANEGYDVWLGNMRGNLYSTHKNLKRSDQEFWEFSYDEHGKYDLPVMMEKILKTTRAQKIHFVGYSMGSTSYFIMCDKRPDMSKKIATFTGLAPAVSLGKFTETIFHVAYFINLREILRSVRVNTFFILSEVLLFVSSIFCAATNHFAESCLRIVFQLMGENFDQIDWDKIETIFVKFQPASVKQLSHYGQMATRGIFSEYDWGPEVNMLKYGYAEPRVYNDSANIAPTALFYGDSDVFVPASNVARLQRSLAPTNRLVIKKRVPFKQFNHLDFIYAKDIHILVNYEVLKMIKIMSNKC